MRPSNILAIFPLAAFAALNGPCTGAPDGTATGLWLSEGVCVTDCVDTRGAAGKTISGGCPFDPDDVKCCLVGLETSLATPCGSNPGASFCAWNTAAKSSFCTGSPFFGKFYTGYCPGPSDYECCLFDA